MNKKILGLIVLIMVGIGIISLAIQSLPNAKLYANGIYFYKEASVLEKINHSYQDYSIKVHLSDQEVSYFSLPKYEYLKILPNEKIYIVFKALPKDDLELVSILSTSSDFNEFLNKNNSKGILTLAYNDANLNNYQIKY